MERRDCRLRQRVKAQKPENWFATIKRIWSYLRVKKGILFLVLLMVVASSAFGLLGPYFVGVSIDQYIVTKDQ